MPLKRFSNGRLSGVEGEGEGPEMVGVTGGVASGGDGDAAAGREETLRFAEVLTQVGVDGEMNGTILEDLEQLGGHGLGDADVAVAECGLDISNSIPRGERGERDGTGEVDAVNPGGAEFVLGIFDQTEAEAGHIDFGQADARKAEDLFETFLLLGQAHLFETKDRPELIEVAGSFENSDNGALLRPTSTPTKKFRLESWGRTERSLLPSKESLSRKVNSE